MSFSMMGKREREKSSQFILHQSYFEKFAPSQEILLLENVTEYSEALVLQCLNKGHPGTWKLTSVRLDPRLLGMGCARARVFMVAYRKNEYAWTKKFTLQQFVECLCSQPTMTFDSYFWSKKTSDGKLSSSEEPWPLSELSCKRDHLCLKFCKL